ncbi:MAG: DUF1836 domain-containing protein [Emergencia timonensis]|uniref:DUF1836 domain-containing protein n=1 Tax=Emergencia timonensis TaxID=1776384 RepID=UPI00082AB25D|nr:DUF1836 domain-containing protein [Emergencia timonensis]WNX89964.1 DUF1836 domain-containing protein [Emergencia timonensis]
MDKIKEFKEQLTAARPEDWEQIPDIDLYMDQVISYMTRQHIGLELENEETLTSAMINNYIKSGLLPRAKGKKYNREHIGYLTAICLLKQVLSVGETGVLLNNQMEHRDIENFYHNYKVTLDNEFNLVAEELKVDASEEELAQLALKMAVSSYAQMLACKKILQAITPEKEQEK